MRKENLLKIARILLTKNEFLNRLRNHILDLPNNITYQSKVISFN